MHETPEDLDRPQEPLDRTYAAGGPHLLEIHTREVRLDASAVEERLAGMHGFVVATVNAHGRVFTGPGDGFLFRGRVHFGTSPSARVALGGRGAAVVGEGAAQRSDVVAADAVVDVTGPAKGGPKDLRGQVTRALLPAVQRQEVTRLLFLTGAGVRVDGDRPKVADRAIRGVMQLLQPAILDDGQAAVAAVTASELDWTVVRVPRLTDGERRGQVRTAAHVGGDTGTTLARADLATFLLDELDEPAWSRQAPIVSW